MTARNNVTGRFESLLHPVQKFLDKVEVTNGCWNWKGAVQTTGYGQFYINHYKGTKAHRFMYEIIHGDISDKTKQVCHSCDNRICVNPEHLWLGSALKNAQDRGRKNRNANVKGEKNHNVKLIEDQVRQIRQLYSEGEMSQQTLATKFGLHQATISQIIRGERWKHVN